MPERSVRRIAYIIAMAADDIVLHEDIINEEARIAIIFRRKSILWSIEFK